MLLRPVNVNPYNTQRVLCSQCGKWSPDRDTYADIEGEPFKAYWCSACIVALPTQPPFEGKD